MSRLRRLERISLSVGGVAALLGLMTSTGCQVVPGGEPSWAWAIHPILFLLGIAAGVAAGARGLEIDKERWSIAQQDDITAGEREWAHKEAESRHRFAATAFALGPILIAYWLTFQLRGESLRRLTDLLLVSTVVGYFGGWYGGQIWARRREKKLFDEATGIDS